MAILQTDVHTVPGRYWHALDDGRVQCDLCPRFCQLRDGQRGLCFVRARQGEQIVLTTYGRSSGFCIDPIEKKPLNHFLPGTPVLSFGTAGCNLACKFCQNWDISKSREIDTLADEATPEAIARAAGDLGCRSVAFTYNDPVIFLEYAIDVAAACRASGIHTVAVTAGEICAEPRREFFPPWTRPTSTSRDSPRTSTRRSAAAISSRCSTRSLSEARDRRLVRDHDPPDPRRERLRRGARRGEPLGGRDLGPDVPLHFTAFHPDCKMLDTPPTPPATLTRARPSPWRNGVRYAYTGNVHDEAGGSTYCHGCGELLIGRDWYVLTAWNLTTTAAAGLRHRLPGRFDGPPGRWGARRLPVRLADYA